MCFNTGKKTLKMHFSEFLIEFFWRWHSLLDKFQNVKSDFMAYFYGKQKKLWCKIFDFLKGFPKSWNSKKSKMTFFKR